MEGDTHTAYRFRISSVFQSTPSAWRETFRETVIVQHSFHFNPLPPHGGRQPHAGRCASGLTFQSTPSAWRETPETTCRRYRHRISIHSLRMEGDSADVSKAASLSAFQSTPSAWRETCGSSLDSCSRLFQSTPSAWRETRRPADTLQERVISIHSLRMEGDSVAFVCYRCTVISIHSLRMEGDTLLS